MRVIVCGAGQVGWQIARQLANENNDVTVVDKDPKLVRRATDTLDVQGITGFASYPDILQKAGASDADMVIAATHMDEVNIVTCQIAHSVFGVPRKIARIRAKSYLDTLYADIYQRDHMPIDVVISPEQEVAKATLMRLDCPSSFDTEFFLDGGAQMLAVTIDDDCPVTNTPLRQLSDLFSTLRATVVAIRRQDGTLFAPEASDQIFAGDSCYIFTHVDDAARTLEIFGKSYQAPKRVLVIGGGNIGLSIAKELEDRKSRPKVRVIERNRDIAETAAELLEKSIVLHGDGLNVELLSEVGIDRIDAVIAVTDDDKTNALACARAKSLGCGNAICLINDPSLVPLLHSMQVDAHVNPRASTVSSILRHIRQGRVRDVYSIGNSEAEIIEAQVMSPSSIAGNRLGDIDFPEGVLVGAIKTQSGDVIRPTGSTVVGEGDILVIFSMADDVEAVERLLQVNIDYF